MSNTNQSQNSTQEKISQKNSDQKSPPNSPANPPPNPYYIRMERVDESTSDTWWSEAARIKMPSPELYHHGDTILCWVNEGDYIRNFHPKEFVGLSDKLKLHFIKLSERMSTLDLIEAIEFEIREKNR